MDNLKLPASRRGWGKKSYKPVSRVLSWAIIYLPRWLPIGINLPTLYLGRAALKAVLYVAFQHARFTRQ